MQWSTDIRQIKAAIFDQAFIGRTWVSCPMGRVVAIRRRKGQLQAMIYGWGRWYNVEHVLIVSFCSSALTRSGSKNVLAPTSGHWDQEHGPTGELARTETSRSPLYQ